MGVVAGALLQGGWAWWMERRREGWAARKSGRLFGPMLFRCGTAASHTLSHATTWAELASVIEDNLEPWPEHAEVFAGTLAWSEWFDIYAAVRALQQKLLEQALGQADMPRPPDP